MDLSRVGFGTYRIGDNAQHLSILQKAAKTGITTFDTSSNYGDGDAEKALSKLLSHTPRETLRIISKGGYIQGKNLQDFLKNPTLKEFVFYQEGCYHSIEPIFLEDQISRSLERLQTSYIDTYLLHNPEYYLLHHLKDKSMQKSHQEEMLRRIKQAFIQLEKEVERGRIKSYGISSNAFSKKPDAFEYIPYEKLISIAKDISNNHHFTTIQLPFNMLETEGLACIKWAKKEHLEVITNRPLNAFYHKSMYRLASYQPSKDYEKNKALILEIAKRYQLHDVTRIIEDIDSLRARFTFPDNAFFTLQQQAFPQLKQHIESKKSEELITLFNKQLPPFFNTYIESVRHESSKHALHTLKEAGYHDISIPIQKTALSFILSHPEIDLVLIGAKQSSYIEELVQL